MNLDVSLLGYKKQIGDMSDDSDDDVQIPGEVGTAPDEVIGNTSNSLVSASVSYSDPIEDFQVPNEMGVDASDGFATEIYSDYLCEECEVFQPKDEHSHNICQIYSVKKPPRAWTKFEKIENAGTEVLYRCIRCRVCKDCKAGDKIELSSARDDLEQGVIDRSVQVDLTKGYVITLCM